MGETETKTGKCKKEKKRKGENSIAKKGKKKGRKDEVLLSPVARKRRKNFFLLGTDNADVRTSS